MEIRHESLIGTFEEKKALVDKFNLMDDDFFSVVMRDKKACSYTLSKLLEKDLTVIEVNTQYAVRNIEGHSVILDALAEDTEHKMYNIEIQVKNDDYHPKRVRYYQASLDTLLLEKSSNYKELPELYLIFISAKDWIKGGRCKYTVKRILAETEQELDNGVHELYFNAAVNDNSFLSELLSYFKNSSADNNNFGELSRAVYYHKRISEGVDSMCQAVKDYGDKREIQGKIEGKLEIVKKLISRGTPLDDALEIAEIDKETFERNK